MSACVTRRAADHAGEPASAVPTPNTSMKTRGTLWPSAPTMSRMGQRGLDDQADARALQHDEQADEDRDRDQQHEHLVGGVIGAEDREGGKSSTAGTRKSTGRLPQIICTTSSITKARPKVNSSSATWPLLVDAAQAEALDRRADARRPAAAR